MHCEAWALGGSDNFFADAPATALQEVLFLFEFHG
jgi:hypothetical protein